MQRRIFISYKTKKDNTEHKVAQRFYDMLTDEMITGFEYDVFLDTQKLRIGEDWADTIFKQLRKTHVLLVLLEEDTAESDWVQREVDIARGLRVAIYPIVVVDEEKLLELASTPEREKRIKDARSEEQKQIVKKQVYDEAFIEFTAKARQRLAIMNLQFDQFDINKNDDGKWIKDFGKHVEILVRQTLNDQRELIQRLQAKNSSPESDKDQRKDKLKIDGHNCEIILTTGDILAVEDVNVIVSSENDFMQMARAFERSTVSGALRFSGSSREGNLKVVEDTIQQQLDREVKHVGGRPVALGEVLATRTGTLHEDQLIQSNARYIFHVAAVRVTFGESDSPLKAMKKAATIKKAVVNCLQLMLTINESHGLLPSEQALLDRGEATDEQKKEFDKIQDNFKKKDLKRIIFPFFGTGRGGRNVEDVLPAMLEGIREFLLKHKGTECMEAIHLSAYSENDRAAALAAIAKFKKQEKKKEERESKRLEQEKKLQKAIEADEAPIQDDAAEDFEPDDNENNDDHDETDNAAD